MSGGARAVLLVGAFMGVCGVVGVAVGSRLPAPADVLSEPARAAEIVGRRMPDLPLVAPSGVRQGLASIVSGSPSVVYVVDRKTCLDCTQIPLEIRIVRRTYPHLKQVLVGAGPDTAFFREYAARQRMSSMTYLDPAESIRAAVGRDAAYPMIFLADDSARVLMLDTRAGPAYSPFGTSRLLGAMGAVLSPSEGVAVADP